MDQGTPQLARRLRTLAPEVRRAILTKSCLFSAEQIGALSVGMALLLDKLKRGDLTPQDAAGALDLAEAANKRSFELEENDAPRQEWLPWFSEARLATAIATMFGAVPDYDEAAAVYPLLSSQDHGSSLEQFLASQIDACSGA